MPPLTAPFFLGLLFVAGSLAVLPFALGIVGQTNKTVRARLKMSRPTSAMAAAQNAVVQVRGTSVETTKLLPQASVATIERNLLLAGRPDGWTVGRVVMLKLLGGATGVLLLYYEVSTKSSLINWAIGLFAIAIGWFAPSVILQRRAEARQHSIQQELPDVLDQVTISIESGLGFEAAFAHIGERRKGPLAEEIVRVVQDMRLGMSRREAYEAMVDRTDVDDLRQFVKSIVQAEQYGVSISQVVRTQAGEIRFKRRKRAEAAALKVPVKILFPLLTCIFPVLFVVILTPAAVNISEVLGSAK